MIFYRFSLNLDFITHNYYLQKINDKRFTDHSTYLYGRYLYVCTCVLRV